MSELEQANQTYLVRLHWARFEVGAPDRLPASFQRSRADVAIPSLGHRDAGHEAVVHKQVDGRRKSMLVPSGFYLRTRNAEAFSDRRDDLAF
jgi:hypothetical protein